LSELLNEPCGFMPECQDQPGHGKCNKLKNKTESNNNKIEEKKRKVAGYFNSIDPKLCTI
jgi:hypothetical protein